MSQRLFICAAAFTLYLVIPLSGFTHEVKPGYLEIVEEETGQYNILWKAPNRSGVSVLIHPVFPEICQDQMLPSRYELAGSLIERRIVNCGPDGLSGKTISIDGLSTSITDVLARVTLGNGQTQTVLLKPQNPSFQIMGVQSLSQVINTYIQLGIKHILYGVDHLLFVFGLLLLSKGWVMLIKTITSFTVGHSISLALATFGVIVVPGKPLNAAIALSIVFLAAELVRAGHGEKSLTIRRPWLVSFGFGILHGVGFASALIQLGLPETDIPLALLCFNVGVEAGQILFVAVVLVVLQAIRKLEIPIPSWTEQLPVYGMGSIAAFWFVGRFMAMF